MTSQCQLKLMDTGYPYPAYGRFWPAWKPSHPGNLMRLVALATCLLSVCIVRVAESTSLESYDVAADNGSATKGTAE